MTVPDPMESAVSFIRSQEATTVGAPSVPAPEAPVDERDAPGAPVDTAVATGLSSDAVVEPDDGAEPAPIETGADFRMAIVASVTLDLPSQHPQVCLRELETPRRQLTFSVGMPDAVALAHAQRRIATPRPLTHELMGEVLRRFDIDIVAVRIVGRVGAVHFAELDLRGRNGRSVHSCRPTDALILALHQPVQVPILIDDRLLAGGGDVTPPGSG